MPCKSIKNSQIPIMTPRCIAKLERNIYVCKSTKYNRSLIRHSRSTMMPRGLSPNMIYALKFMGRRF